MALRIWMLKVRYGPLKEWLIGCEKSVIIRATGISSTAEMAMYTKTLSASGVWLLASFITKACVPQQMNTREASRIQRLSWVASSDLLESEKQTSATKASRMPRAPSLLTRSFRKMVDRMTVTIGATEMSGKIR